MADGLSREERVAAGLKKLKQFQQRAAKKPSQGASKKSVSIESSPARSTEDLTAKSGSIKPSHKTQTPELYLEEKTAVLSRQSDHHNTSHTNLISSSGPMLYNNVSISQNSLITDERGQCSEAITKSKSDLDITTIKDLSSTESLRQISQQINGLMSETHAFFNGNSEQSDNTSIKESQSLERRNQELAAQVDSLQQSYDHLQFQLQEAKAKANRLQREFERERQELSEKAHKDQVSVKDQLQVHIQTIGILVAEKTELQSSLSLSQQTAKQKAAEVEELQGRLRGSRQRATDLERELNSVNTSNQQFEKGNKESSKEIDRLKLDNYKLSKSIEELRQQSSELSEKLNIKASKCQNLESELTDSRSKLSLSELYVQQLNQGINSENPSQVEELHLEKLELQKKVSLHKESIDKLISERDQMSEQYQSYIQQLSQQVTSLRDELKHIGDEKETIAKEKNALQEKLETRTHNQDSLSKENHAELKLQLAILENKKNELGKDLETQVSDNAQMSKLVSEQEDRISDLESRIQRLQEQEVDKSRLLETIQSDKVAASRAVAQNRVLKKQLEELQTGFVTMSNDKLELTEKLHSEQHITKELGERLSQQEEELHELKDQLAEKEDRLENLTKSNTKGMYQQSQIADRMRHYEAQGQLADMLQQELTQAKERINVLVNQNTELRMALARQAEVTVNNDNTKEDRDAAKRNDLVASLSTSVRQLEMERDQMMKQLEEQKTLRTKLDTQIRRKEDEINQGHDDNNDAVSKDDYALMKNAMQQLEGRFKQTMYEIAELSDEKQQLEHLVMQLQGETDTIGDYIALYQIQRGLMRKRASEKDDYIAQLATDREDLKAKLGELQDLVMRLMEERKQYHSQGIVALDSTPDFIKTSSSPDNSAITVDSPDVLPVTASAMVPDVTSNINGETYRKSENTARKIMDLLTEIGTTNLVEKTVTDNFHPCPVCSGRLITV